MSGAVIKKCTCAGNANVSHAAKYQDSKYGAGNRVMNLDVKRAEATCTVCGKVVKV